MSTSIVLAAHGSIVQPQVNERVCKIAKRLESGGTFDCVVAAFHQGEPQFSDVLDQLPRGRTIVIPYMTSAGYYCDEVLPRELRKNRAFDAGAVQITKPVGAHPKLCAFMIKRARELIQSYELNQSQMAILLVGHGTSRHAASRNTTIELADKLQSEFANSRTIAAFIDEEPSLESVFESVSNLDCIVLPFFMSAGPHTSNDLPHALEFEEKLNDKPLYRRDESRQVILDLPVGLNDGIVDIVIDLATSNLHVPTKEKTIRLGTRGSKMAVWQANHVAQLLSADYDVEIVEHSTLGDRDRGQPIDALPSAGPFTDEIEEALLDGRIDLAVHSLKDLPLAETPGTSIPALLPRGDARECVVTRDRVSLAKLKPGATVGTSCARRAIQVLRLRPDVRIVPLRGPVDDRVKQVYDGKMDAAILAWVGLERLDLLNAVDEVFEIDQFLPAAGQAALAVQVRADDQRMIELVSRFDDSMTRVETNLELNLQRAVEEDENLTVAAFAKATDYQFRLQARIMAKASHESLDFVECGDSPEDVLNAALTNLSWFRHGLAQELAH